MPPLIGTMGAASAKGFGMFTALGGGAFFMLSPTNASFTRKNRSTGFVQPLTNKSVVFSGFGTDSPANTNGNVCVLNSSGVPTTTKYLDVIFGGSELEYAGVTYRASNDTNYYAGNFIQSRFYVSTVTNISSTPALGSFVTQTASASGFSSFSLRGEVEIDASGNLYQSGVSDYFASCCVPYQRPVVAKGTMSGLSFLRGQTTFSGSGFQYVSPGGLKLESGSNLVVCGSIDFNNLYLMKMGTASGTVVYQRSFSGIPSTQPAFMGIDINTADNSVYVTSTSIGAFYLSKFNSSGTHLFTKPVTGMNSVTDTAVKVGADGFIYVYTTMANSSSRYEYGIFKFDSSGTLQWQRIIHVGNQPLSQASENYIKNKLAVSSDGFVYINMNIEFYAGNSNGCCILLKYPTSGAITGSYAIPGNTLNIANGSYSVSTGSAPTVTAVSITYGNATLGSASTTPGTFTLGDITGRTSQTTPL
jgi:hypothetical protein